LTLGQFHRGAGRGLGHEGNVASGAWDLKSGGLRGVLIFSRVGYEQEL
jgi:hypothetical protein